MNIMKKIASTMSALAVVAGMASIPASAVNTSVYSVSYDTLTQTINTNDGSVVPAGSVAVTVSVSGNRGFDANTFILDIGENNTIVMNQSGSPLVTKSQLFDDAFIATDSADSRISVAVAMSGTFDSNGNLFTFYINGENNDNADVEILSTDEQNALTTSCGNSAPTDVYPKLFADGHWYLCYYSGDANGDANNLVNASDATMIRSKLESVGVTGFDVSSSGYTNNYNTYFPNIVFKEQPDADLNGVINDADAVEILTYAVASALGNPYYGNAHTELKGMMIN